MFEVLNANGSLPASRLYLYDKANGLVLIGKGRPSGIVPLGNRLGVTTVFLTDSVGNVLSESSLTSKYRMTELPSLPDTIAADSIGAWLERIGSSDGKSVFARFATKNECWNQFAESELQYKSDYASPLPFPDNFFKENAKNRSVDLQMDKRSKPVDSKIIFDNDSYPSVSPHEKYSLWQSEYAESKATVNGMMQGGQLPDVVVKARVKRDEHLSTEKFYSYNYVGREKIEQYNYLYLVDILRGIPSVMVRYNPENSKNPWQISSNRGMSTLNASSEGLVILLDGSRVENEQKADVLQMSADEIETVELLRPWQALAYTWGAVDGAIKVMTRGADKSKVRSKGIFYTPFGLSVVKGNPKTTVAPGKYRLLMDVVSPTGITSFERDVVVSE